MMKIIEEIFTGTMKRFMGSGEPVHSTENEETAHTTRSRDTIGNENKDHRTRSRDTNPRRLLFGLCNRISLNFHFQNVRVWLRY